MSRVIFILMLALLWFVQPASAQTTLPMDKGLPVLVQTAVAFVDLTGFDENTGNFRATVDVVGDGVTVLDTRDVFFLVPPEPIDEPVN